MYGVNRLNQIIAGRRDYSHSQPSHRSDTAFLVKLRKLKRNIFWLQLLGYLFVALCESGSRILASNRLNPLEMRIRAMNATVIVTFKSRDVAARMALEMLQVITGKLTLVRPFHRARIGYGC